MISMEPIGEVLMYERHFLQTDTTRAPISLSSTGLETPELTPSVEE